MERHDNPFHDLWLTEILNPSEFVQMFSPFVVKNMDELFGTTNVVVRGTQGSGKSMLLNLLSTTTRIAYERSSGEKYPWAGNGTTFIAAGIHLIRDNAKIVASRLSEIPEDRRENWAAATFADYVNYVLVQDMLFNVTLLAKEQAKDGCLKSQIEIKLSDDNERNFVEKLSSSNALFGYFSKCKSLDDVSKRVSERLQAYRRYFNFHHDKLDKDVDQTKTVIGEPMIVLAEALRDTGIIPSKTLFFLRIDQHEELYALERTSRYGDIFRKVINGLLALRDSRVSYRVGTRYYAWSEEVGIWGSGAALEHMRDYIYINLEEVFRRPENKRVGTPFDNFAEDVFRRRLKASSFELTEEQMARPLETVFGSSLPARERASRYGKPEKPLLKIPKDWDPKWKVELEALWRKGDFLQAKLGGVWLRQELQQKKNFHRNRDLVAGYPWMEHAARYWVKERNEAALIQMAGAAIQALVWCGKQNIIDLAGSNILSFMSICRAIWSAWLRNVSDKDLAELEGPPSIWIEEQIIGINEASKIWFDKLREGLDGDRRTAFISALGSWFAKSIREDRALSNPGHNGFSLLRSDLESQSDIVQIIKNSLDHGDLIESDHTTKMKDQKPRKKWYLHPLLCPYFRIPYVRTKEPIYTSVEELEQRFRGARSEEDKGMLKVKKRITKKKSSNSKQTQLF
ncbi:hypothetical protein [Dyella silvatica]|uniref:ORC-CDC6 family AAA ATPase n=1 Tax=Dyella silvatica TaxID=2992128 RepID=UPI002259D38F|nr:hypothetical protein [Dyella silvatica]